MKALILGFAAMNLIGFSAQASDATLSTPAEQVEVSNDCENGKVFTRRSAIHSSSYQFKCSYSDEFEVKRSAEQSAEASCYKAGFTTCRAVMSRITETGYLGYQQDFGKSLGYGCIAEALVRGSNY